MESEKPFGRDVTGACTFYDATQTHSITFIVVAL